MFFLFLEGWERQKLFIGLGVLLGGPSCSSSLSRYFVALHWVWYLYHSYVDFGTRTITTLKKLHGMRSFGGSIGHLTCCQVTLPTLHFMNELGLLSIV